MSKSYKEEVALLAISGSTTRDYSTVVITHFEILAENPDGTMVVRSLPEILSVGTARKDPVDKPNHSIGFGLATGRALHNLGHKMIKQANGFVKHADDIKIIRAEQAARKDKAFKKEKDKKGADVVTVVSNPSTAASPPKTRTVATRTKVTADS